MVQLNAIDQNRRLADSVTADDKKKDVSNNYVKIFKTSLTYSIQGEKINAVITDKITGEVIRKIPTGIQRPSHEKDESTAEGLDELA